MSRPRARRWLLPLGLLVVGLVVVAGSGVAAGGSVALPENNSTVQQEDPAVVDDTSSLDGLSGTLATRLARQLGDSSIQLSQAQYDQARELAGEDARSTLGKFVDVAGETDGEADDETADILRETRNNQRALVNTTQAYRETYADYQDAKANGNEERARRLARELQRLSESVQRNGGTVRQNYVVISNRTGTDLSEAIEAVNATIENVTAQQAAVREATFLQTTLSVRADARAISFTDPLVLDGRLTTANESAVANRTVTIRVASRRYTVETNRTGAFAFVYRPTTLRLDTDAVRVRYVPNATSVYLGSAASVPVDVRQIEPSVTVSRSPPTLGFTDRLTVSGRVGANGTGAAGVPLVITVGAERVARTTTGPNGTYNVSTQLPAAVLDGTRRVRVTVDTSEQALARATGSRRVTVSSTPSTVSVTATQQAPNSTVVVIQGRVTGAAQGVPSTLVRLRLGETTTESVRTNETGWFRTTVDVSASLAPRDGTVTRQVIAQYAGEETSLNASNATTTVRLSFTAGNADAAGGSGSTASGPLERSVSAATGIWRFLTANPLVAGAITVLGLGAILGWLRRRRGGPTAPDATGTASASTEPASPTAGAATSERPSLLARARTELAAGDAEDAIRLSYAAVRTSLPEADSSLSHWEFYQACAANGYAEQQVTALQELTEGYERAAFAPETPTPDQAASTVDAATRVLEPTAATD